VRVDGPEATFVFRDETAAGRFVAVLLLLGVLAWPVASSAGAALAFPVLVSGLAVALAAHAWFDRPVVRISTDELAVGREGREPRERYATARVGRVVVRVNLATQLSVLDAAGTVVADRWLRFVTGRALADALDRAEVTVERRGRRDGDPVRPVDRLELTGGGRARRGLTATGVSVLLTIAAFPVGADVAEALGVALLAVALAVLVLGWLRALRPTPHVVVTAAGADVAVAGDTVQLDPDEAHARLRASLGGVVLAGEAGQRDRRLTGLRWRDLLRASHLWPTPLDAASDGAPSGHAWPRDGAAGEATPGGSGPRRPAAGGP
jgi:hypothetical protein